MNLIQRRKTGTLPRIFWWEKQRIIFNLVMAVVGYGSFFIGYITIPLLYILIAINLNVLFTFSWIIEILFVKPINSDKATQNYTILFLTIFYGYSTIGVLLFSYFPSFLDWTFIPWGLAA